MNNIKGYYVSAGYMGYVDYQGRYMLFTNESEYIEYMSED